MPRNKRCNSVLVLEYIYFFVHPTFLITKFMYIKIIKIDHSLQAVLDSLVTDAEALMEAKNDKFAYSDFFSGWSSNIDEYFIELIMLFEFVKAPWPFDGNLCCSPYGLDFEFEFLNGHSQFSFRVLFWSSKSSHCESRCARSASRAPVSGFVCVIFTKFSHFLHSQRDGVFQVKLLEIQLN